MSTQDVENSNSFKKVPSNCFFCFFKFILFLNSYLMILSVLISWNLRLGIQTALLLASITLAEHDADYNFVTCS
jgi:hypothetical protein